MKRSLPSPRLVTANASDYNVIQNLARFYVYDMSRYCGFISSDWACPEDGLFQCFDYRSFFEDPLKSAFFIKVLGEIAGFVLVRTSRQDELLTHFVSEFFILAKFQRLGIGEKAAHMLWRERKGSWELLVIPENIRGLNFWRKTIGKFTDDNFTEEDILIDYDKAQPHRYLFSFESRD